ncbi:Zinc finger, FYVE/PHD-type [Akanthomyces lecanii RCEF 1005]|uniref:Zinc finger, FYVE/PHD-type n=1 Tax=Akanthomyces lecanii RCEF 1005 TaxID=1081108 RepID=A0A162N2B7_CORDF|nr:Zinc finger, FYVE/PHD-type [Akanthomyces lecanii RCEF 1005]
MSGRRLGGGRILGSGKGLAPPPAAPRAPSPLAPSDSTVSIGSSSLSPPISGSLPDIGQDIVSSISVGAQPKAGLSSDGGLLCPICNEEMVTLLQLNRHIDDNHQELPAEEQDEVKTWFDKQVLKAKRFQPLSLINQKLRGLEVFESNESVQPQQQIVSHAPGKAQEVHVDPEELITKIHWQRPTGHDRCTDPACGKNLGPMNGSINCRKCGRLFCEEHTMYQMKLSRSANHEPIRGVWARVCETCYKSRDGYNDHAGVSSDHTNTFIEIRRNRVERQKLEVSRLEKRLTKLTKLLVDPPEKPNGSLLSPVSQLTGQNNQRKAIEQSVVPWEDDESVANLDVAPPSHQSTEKPPPATGLVKIGIRMCQDCNHTIFSGRDFNASLEMKPADQRSYETLRQFERGIRQLLPSFHRVLLALQPDKLENGEVDLNKPPPTRAQIQEAGKIRKRLIDSFGKYGIAAKRIRDLPTQSPTQQRLQTAIYSYASTFLHTNMVPLKSLPQLLRNQSPRSARSTPHLSVHSGSSGLRHTELAESDTASQAASEASTVVSQLETEEKGLREGLAVLEEQRFMVEEMLRAATRARRFEEISALNRNMDELEAEIQALKGKISGVEAKWEGVYRDGIAS